MVSELAPVILLLRHRLKQGDLLIFEEPESHLHPRSQLRLARGLARIVNDGGQVVVTTHSDFFLAALNNCIRASASTSSVRRATIPSSERIPASQVAAYSFDHLGRKAGTVVRPIRVTLTNGIPETEFVRVSRQLYEETVKLETV